nr:MAG TPA: hypothetical protein [Caudoviricetes sp.]
MTRCRVFHILYTIIYTAYILFDIQFYFPL